MIQTCFSGDNGLPGLPGKNNAWSSSRTKVLKVVQRSDFIVFWFVTIGPPGMPGHPGREGQKGDKGSAGTWNIMQHFYFLEKHSWSSCLNLQLLKNLRLRCSGLEVQSINAAANRC